MKRKEKAAFDDAVRIGDAGPLLWCYRYSGRKSYLLKAFKVLRRVGVCLTQREKDYFRECWQSEASARVGRPRTALLRDYHILSLIAFFRKFGVKRVGPSEKDLWRKLRPGEAFDAVARERDLPVRSVRRLWHLEQRRLKREEKRAIQRSLSGRWNCYKAAGINVVKAP